MLTTCSYIYGRVPHSLSVQGVCWLLLSIACGQIVTSTMAVFRGELDTPVSVNDDAALVGGVGDEDMPFQVTEAHRDAAVAHERKRKATSLDAPSDEERRSPTTSRDNQPGSSSVVEGSALAIPLEPSTAPSEETIVTDLMWEAALAAQQAAAAARQQLTARERELARERRRIQQELYNEQRICSDIVMESIPWSNG